MLISFCLDLIVSENAVANMNKGEKSWNLCSGGRWRQAADIRRGMSICTLKASPPCETTILIETKKSETILDLSQNCSLKTHNWGKFLNWDLGTIALNMERL